MKVNYRSYRFVVDPTDSKRNIPEDCELADATSLTVDSEDRVTVEKVAELLASQDATWKNASVKRCQNSDRFGIHKRTGFKASGSFDV